jgi:hypothetical protein
MRINRVLLVLVVAVNSALAFQTAAKTGSPLPPCGLKNELIDVELLSPLSTATAKPGDTFTSNVVSPDRLKGAKIEGDVKNLVKAERGLGKGKPRIELEFSTLTFNNRTCQISGELRDVKNSKGVAHVDDEGRAIGHTSNKKRIGSTVGGAMLGALVGFAGGGGGGAIAGAAAGGLAGFIISSTMTTAGTDISFKPGSLFTLNVSDVRGGARH